MKKIIPILFIITILFTIQKKEEILIPDYAIRFRVIANSNTIEDQALKIQVKDEIENTLNASIKTAKTSEDAKEIIINNLSTIKDKVNQLSPNSQISFGKNFFPTKQYKGVTYPSGEYTSLVITLGSGAGENWWCVMFPPLCLLEQKDDTTKVEYKFFIEEMLKKYSS